MIEAEPSRRPPLTSVIVVCHNSGEVLSRCAEAILAQTSPIELIVVDNGSVDGSAERVAADARRTLLRNNDNPGFATACNQGAAVARGDHLLFLNPDCLLAPDTIARLREIAVRDAKLAVLGAQLLNADGSPQGAARRRTPTPMRALHRALGWDRDAVEMQAEATSERSAQDDVEKVDAVSGALMLMPRDTFNALGGFDRGYVLHCEDLDLCRRALLAGYRVGIARDVRVTHLKGTSSQRRPVWVEWQKHRGMLRYFRKFDAADSPWWLRLLVPLGVWLRFPVAASRAMVRARVSGGG